MTDPTADLETWAATYRERRRPGPARRRAIQAAVRAGAAAQDRQIHRQRWIGMTVLAAAAVLLAFALARLLDGRATAVGTDETRSLAPHSAPTSQARPLHEREATARAKASEPSSAEDEASEPSALPSEPSVVDPPSAHDPGVPATPGVSAKPAAARKTAEPRRSASPEPASEPALAPDELEGMRLLRDAERRLEHDAAASLRLLERHAERFPASPLALEREALTVIALCRLGRLEAGRERQRAFLRRPGSSAYAARVARACEDSP